MIKKCGVTIRNEARDELDVLDGRCRIVFFVKRMALRLDEMLPEFGLQANTWHFHYAVANETICFHKGINDSVRSHFHLKFHKEPEVRRSYERKRVGCRARQYPGG